MTQSLDLIEMLTPTAAELGCSEELADVASILRDRAERGPPARRGGERAGGSLDVVHSLIDELETDIPGAR